jgi:hypothetical protein
MFMLFHSNVTDVCVCGDVVQAGGAYTLNTGSSVTVRSTIRRLREQTEL